MKIGYLGPKGSFTYSAVKNYFQNGEWLPYISLTDLIDAQTAKEIDYAMVPIENSIEGSVLPALDHVYETLPKIQGEIVLPIKQQLMVHPKNQEGWRSVTKICSHPQALAQSQIYLKKYFPQVEIEQMSSTAQGAQQVAEHPSEKLAAIGPREAAEQFGLIIVQEDIHSIRDNETRFWLLGQSAISATLPILMHKATLFVDLPENHPGALYQVLAVFAEKKLNLTKIESRPQKTRLGEYFFVIEVEITPSDNTLEEVIDSLQDKHFPVQLIGKYPVYRKL
ncbi:prephenate dehydratase [Enterococcus hirae]|nr:prephenate dehydratase [Enterococcus hirae]